MAGVEIVPVGTDRLEDLGDLFDANRSTRRCSCMAFCSGSGQFAWGWFRGGNRRRFEAMATTETAPMGALALIDGRPAGWCACGPRSRYTAALPGRSRLLAGVERAEDESVWLIACLVLGPVSGAMGTIRPLLRGAIELARTAGAVAIEAWPQAHGVRRPALDHVGREALFAPLGFRRSASPTPDRVILRLPLS